MDSFPAYFPLSGRRVVIVGSGEMAEGKARLFKGSPAEVVRVEDEARAFEPETYRGAALAFIAGDDEGFCIRAATAAREAGAPVNVVDRPALCDFYTPALVDRGSVVAAVGTGGSSPVLSRRLKEALASQVPEGTGQLAALLQEFRDETRKAFPDIPKRSAFIEAVIDGPVAKAAYAGEMETARRLMREALARG